MLCANYYTSVIKNLLPPTAGPPPLPSFSVCKLAKTKREIQEGTSLPACAICVCAKAAGRCRGLCGAAGISGQGARLWHLGACLFLILGCGGCSLDVRSLGEGPCLQSSLLLSGQACFVPARGFVGIVISPHLWSAHATALKCPNSVACACFEVPLVAAGSRGSHAV